MACLLFAATAAWSLTVALLGSTEALLFCTPALLLALPLAFGRYLGEAALETLRVRHRAPTRAPAALVRPRLAPLWCRVPRGGGLIAASLAKRPPPALLFLN